MDKDNIQEIINNHPDLMEKAEQEGIAVDQIADAIASIIEAIGEIWEAVKNAIHEVIETLSTRYQDKTRKITLPDYDYYVPRKITLPDRVTDRMPQEVRIRGRI